MIRPKSKYIRIEEPRILKNRLLLSKISCSGNIEKYFQQKFFRVEYDSDIQSVSTSILQIPVFSNLITVAWAVGADVHVRELDRSYLESLNKIKLVLKKWYPRLPFSTHIYVEKTVSNKFSNQKYGLLFSGGVDSTTSYIRQKKKPNLMMVWGADIPLAEKGFWRKVKNRYKDFAKQENVEIDFIKTNLHEFIDEGPLNVDFGRYLTGSWWGSIHHGIGILGLCAPVTVIKHIGTLLIASSTNIYPKVYPWGSHWVTDNKLSWADAKIVHDGYKLNRQEKIRRTLKNHIKNTGRYPLLRVCYSQFRDFNCSKCEKCCRTITGLILENIDPNKCGFSIESNFFDFLKANLLKGEFIEYPGLPWYNIQRQASETVNQNLYNSKEFFKWFRHFDIPNNTSKRKVNITWCLFYIYYKLPKNIRKLIAKLKPIAGFLISFQI